MKINGTDVRGIKKAVGEWELKYKRNITIIYDRQNKEISTVSLGWYEENCNERLSGGYLRYENIIDLIRDVYPLNYKISMTTIQAILREYVI